MAESISRLVTEYVSNGAEKAIADYTRVQAAEKKMADQALATVSVNDTVAKSVLGVQSKLDAYARSMDPAAKALAQVERGEKLVAQARAQGITVTAAQERALDNARARHDLYTKAVNDNVQAYSLNRTQLMMFQSAVSNTASSLGSGASAMQVMMQQGPDLVQAFGMGPKGVGGTFAALKSTLAPALTGTVGVVAGIAASLLTAGFAVSDFKDRQDKLALSLNGVGRASGVTVDGLSKIAALGASKSNLTIGTATDAAAMFAQSGIDGSIMVPLMDASKKYAKATGQDISDAMAQAAAAFADPAKGADELNKKLLFLDAGTKAHIQSLMAQGDMLRAQNVLLEKFAVSGQRAVDVTTKWGEKWASVKSGASSAWDFIGRSTGRVLFGPTPEQDLAEKRQKYNELAAAPRSAFTGLLASVPGGRNAEIADAKRKMDEAQAKVDAANAEAERRKAEVLAIQRAEQARSVGMSLNPDDTKLRELTDNRELMRKTLLDPELLKASGLSAEQAARAFATLDFGVKNFANELQRISQDSALASRQTEAYTYAQKAQVAAERARLDAINSGKSELIASAESERARNQIIADGNRKAADMAREAKDQLSLAGLSPYERSVKEIENKYKNFNDQYAPNKSADPMVAGFTRVTSATDRLSVAFDALAGKIGNNPASSLPMFAGGAANQNDKGAIAEYIKSASLKYGIDPDIALRVAKSEGLNSYIGDKGTSFGPYQLHYGGLQPGALGSSGLGDVFTRQTGLDARNPATVQAQIDFALSQASKNGWGAWYGAKRVGINEWDGINGNGVAPLKSTAVNVANSAKADELTANQKSRIEDPFRSSSLSIAEMERQAANLNSSLGKTTAQLAGEAEAEKLRSAYINDGILNANTSAEALRMMNERIAETGKKATDAALALEKAKENQQKRIADLDLVRSTSNDVLSSPLKALAHGENAGDALKASALRLGDKMIDMSVNSLTTSMFGKMGQEGGGLFGSILGSLFGAGQGVTAAQATVNAGVVNVMGGVGGLTGGGGGLSGIFSDLFGSGGTVPYGPGMAPFANGGIMSDLGPVPLRKYAKGGIANSPQMALFGEGGMNEAYVPLPDGRSIPVSLRMAREHKAANQNTPTGSVGSGHTSFIVHNHAGVDVQQQESRSPSGEKQLIAIIRKAVASDIADHGDVSKAMMGVYGVRRQGR